MKSKHIVNAGYSLFLLMLIGNIVLIYKLYDLYKAQHEKGKTIAIQQSYIPHFIVKQLDPKESVCSNEILASKNWD